MDDSISRQAAIEAIMGQPPEPHYPSWYAEQIEKLPAVQPAANCSEIPNGSDDTISRQMALDAFGLSEKTRKYGGDHSGYDTRMLYEIQDTLESLPAVQPDHNADISKKVEGDCISRQAAIDLLKQMRKDGDMIPWEGKDVFARIRKLPPAQPEIIRCKDCKRWMREYLDINGKHGCNVMREYTAPNDYCYKAERKE